MKYRVLRNVDTEPPTSSIVESRAAEGIVAEWDELEPFETSSGYVSASELGEHVGKPGRYFIVPPVGDYGMPREIVLVAETRLVESTEVVDLEDSGVV